MNELGIMVSLVVAATLALGAAYSGLVRRDEPGRLQAVSLMVMAAAWAVLYAFEIVAPTLTGKVWWARVEYAPITAIPVIWLLFALAYSGGVRRVSGRSIALLSVIPVVTVVMAFTSGYHGLLWADVGLIETSGLTLFDATYGPWFVIHSVYSYGLIIVGAAFFLVESFRSQGVLRAQTLLVVFAALAPLLANALSLTSANPWPGLDLTPFAFILMGAAMIWGVVGFRLFDLAPVARHSIVEGMAEGVLVLGRDGLVIDANPAAARILSVDSRELIGRPPPPALREWTDFGRPSENAGGDEASVTLGPDGRMYDVLRDRLVTPAGRQLGTLVLLRDETEYRRSLEAARRSEERFKELFDQAPVGIHDLDLSGVITRANRTELKLLGYEEHELVGRHTWDVVVEKESDRRALEDAVRAGKILDPVVEREYVRKDGTTFRAIGESIALNDDEGRHVGFRTTVQDVTELDAANEELRRLARQSQVVIEIGRVVGSSLDLQKIYSEFADLVGRVVPYDRLVISLKDDATGTVIREYVTGLNVPGWGAGESHQIELTIESQPGFTDKGRLAVGERAEQDAANVEGAAAAYRVGIRSFIDVPLVAENRTIGALAFASLEPFAYDDRHLAAAESVALQIAGAIANAKLHATVEKEAAERDVLAAIGRIMSSTLEIDEVYEQFAEQVGRLIPFDRINIVEFDLEADTVTNTYVAGVDVPELRVGAVTPIPRSSAARAVLAGSKGVLMTGDEQAEAMGDSIVEAGNRAAGLLSKISVPLTVGGSAIGVLNLRSRDPDAYTQEHLRIAQSVCTQISGALAMVARHNRLLKAQVALRESEERFRQMFSQSPVAVAIVGLDNKFLRVNPAFCDLLGFQDDEMVGRSFLDLTYADDVDDSQAYAERLMSGQASTVSFGKRFVAKDETAVWVNVTAAMVHDDAGEPIYVLGMVEDISERKKSEQIERMYRYRLEIHANEIGDKYREAEALRVELEQENKNRLRFLNILSHELRTPLTPIISSGELLAQRMGSDPDNEKLLSNVLAGASALKSRIDDLLDVAAFESGTYVLKKVPIDIGKLVREVCDLLGPEAVQRNQTIDLEISDALPVLEADGDRIKQVLINLLSNAMNFGDPKGTVTVRVTSDGDAVSLEVEDRGRGITEDEQERLFEPYFRTEQDRHRFPGLGLGLAVSKQIVEAHGGLISVKSAIGAGSTFTARFPLSGRPEELPTPIRRGSLRPAPADRRP